MGLCIILTIFIIFKMRLKSPRAVPLLFKALLSISVGILDMM